MVCLSKNDVDPSGVVDSVVPTKSRAQAPVGDEHAEIQVMHPSIAVKDPGSPVSSNPDVTAGPRELAEKSAGAGIGGGWRTG